MPKHSFPILLNAKTLCHITPQDLLDSPVLPFSLAIRLRMEGRTEE